MLDMLADSHYCAISWHQNVCVCSERPSRDGSATAESSTRLFNDEEQATLDMLSDARLTAQERLERLDRADQPSGGQLQTQQSQQSQAVSHSDNVPVPIWCAAHQTLTG